MLCIGIVPIIFLSEVLCNHPLNFVSDNFSLYLFRVIWMEIIWMNV